MWLVPWSDLTPDQQRAAQLNPNEHRVIFGAPGAGKTMILLHRAAILMQERSIPAERVRIFVFTKVLKDYIRSALGYLNIPEDNVSTFASWCLSFHQANIGKIPWSGGPDFEKIQAAVHGHLQATPPAVKPFDVVLVDEGQDLDRQAFEILRAISHHITVCMDHKQQIYDGGSDEMQILRTLGLRKRNMSLLEAYRCTPYIVQIASSFIASAEERDNYMRQTRVAQSEKETPLFYLARDFEDEKRRLVEIVKVRQSKGERIAILFGLQRQVAGFAKGLRELGLEVETPANFKGKDEGLDFNSDLPKLMPFHSAKGLTFDTVLMPRLNAKSFGQFSGERIERLLFVGITRATKWIYLSSDNLESLRFLEQRVQELSKAGHLSVQHHGQASGEQSLFEMPTTAAPKIEIPDDDDDSLSSLF
jgi:superfamily I DNA/RNA helicase